jgi:N-methylhydantoinase A/oxoprolinase/acetone carboxylase beta subunit
MGGGSIYLGIDTGGTFTDGVLLKPETGEVLKSVKVLAPHHDLRGGGVGDHPDCAAPL